MKIILTFDIKGLEKYNLGEADNQVIVDYFTKVGNQLVKEVKESLAKRKLEADGDLKLQM